MQPLIQGRTQPVNAPAQSLAEREAPCVHVAMKRLEQAKCRLLSVQSELFKRLIVVSRMEREAQAAGGSVPEPSTNCQLADSINGIASEVEAAASGFEVQLSALEV